MWSVAPAIKQMKKTQKLSFSWLISLFFTLIYFFLFQMYKWKDRCGLFENIAWWWYLSPPKVYLLMDKNKRCEFISWSFSRLIFSPTLILQFTIQSRMAMCCFYFCQPVLGTGVKKTLYCSLPLKIPFYNKPSLKASCAQLYNCFTQKCLTFKLLVSGPRITSYNFMTTNVAVDSTKLF